MSARFATARRSAVLAAALAVPMALATPGAGAAAACTPKIIDRGTLPGGSESVINSGNNRGAFVGRSDATGSSEHAVVFRANGSIQRLPDLGRGGEAEAINDAGVVVGSVTDKFRVDTAAIWRNGKLQQLNDFGYVLSSALDINSTGDVVGWVEDIDARTYPVVWRGGAGRPHLLPLLPGDDNALAQAINDAGLVGGYSYNQQEQEWHPHAVFWRNGQAIQVDRPAQRGLVEDINASGRGTGVLFGAENRSSMALFSRGSSPTYLSGLPGTHFNHSYSINASGQVAGSNSAPGGSEHAVVWPGTGPVLTLWPLSGQWSRDDAYATYLSDAGTAAGASRNLTTGHSRATVWTCAFAQAFQP